MTKEKKSVKQQFQTKLQETHHTSRNVSVGQVFTCVICFLIISCCFAVGAHALCTKVPTANLRIGPGTRYEIGWTVNKYMPFKKIGVSLSGKWYAVEDVDNAVLWIHKSLVTSKIRCAVVNTDAVNLRTGPGVRYEKRFIDPVEKYSCFRMLNRKGSWIRLKDENGNIGWVHRDYLWIQ